MTAPNLTETQADAFFEDVDNAWLDSADQHNIHYGLAQTLLIEHLIADARLGAPDEARAFVMACLAELDSPPNSPAERDASKARNQAGHALAMKLAEQIDATRLVTVTPGARLQ